MGTKKSKGKHVGERCYLYGRRDHSKRYENSATLIRKLLLNYDLEISRVQTLVNQSQSELGLYDGLVKELEPLKKKPKKIERRKQAMALIEFRQYSQYLTEIKNQRAKLEAEVDTILSKYEENYKKVFELAFIQRGYTSQMIANEVGYSLNQTMRIISTMGEELIRLHKKQTR